MDINNILNTSSEEELTLLLAKFSEETIISKVAEYINDANLSVENRENLLNITAQLLTSTLEDKFAVEKQSMELDGFLRYLFAPNDKGVSNFIKLGDLNVQTAKLAADDLPGVLETERRNMVEKLKDDLDYVENYEQYQPEAFKDINRKDDTLDNMYNRYFERVPDINNILESREKTRKNKMLQDQKETEKNIVKEYNEGTSVNSGDLKKQVQALKLLRNKAEQEGNFQLVKDYTKKINMLVYKLRYQTEENDPVYGKGEPADKKQIVIEEAKEGMSNVLSAGKKYQARLQGKVHQFGDITDDDEYISGKLSSKKIEILQQQADDINKSLAYVYCSLHDYKLYLLQYTKNSGKEEAPDTTQFKEYTQIYEAYAYYSDLFLETLNNLNKKGYLKGFPISEEFIGRDLGADVTESEEKSQKSRETYAEKTKKDINNIPIDFKYQMKLPKVESFLGKSEGKIIKNTPVSNEALVDEKLQQYEDQLQLGDILSADEKTLRLKANELKKQKDIAEQAGDIKKVTKLNKDIKTIYQHLDSLSKGREVPQQNTVPQEETKQVSNPDAFFLDDINADDIDVDSIDDSINKTSNFISLEKAIENLYVRYAASQDDVIKGLLDETEGTQPLIESNTSDVVEDASYEEDQDVDTSEKPSITNDKKVQKLSDEIKNRIKQFSDKSVLQKVVELYQKAADGFADIQEKVKNEIKYEDIAQAIDYYKQNRQKLRTAAEITIYQYMKYASEESTDALSIILSAMDTLKTLYREKYRQTNGVGQYILPILEYLPKLESNMSKESIKEFKRLVGSARDEFKGVDTPERTYYSIIPAKVRSELISPINDIYFNLEKLQPIQSEKGKGESNQKPVGTDPLSVSAAKINGLYKESRKLFDSFGMNLGHLGKVDNTYTTILFAHKVFGIKNTFKLEEGEKTWTGFQSNGNSAVPNTVGGVDKLGFYKALKLYPSFLGEVAKMMEKTANEINDTPMKYNISKTIDHGLIGTLPGIYKTNHPNYNYKVRKTK